SGAEEHKMGITGSSTTAVYLDNVPVPVENVLGEIGRGHVIAFNILNIGRLKLGPATVGAAKNVLAISIKYAKQRKAFGSTISEFGAIQHKLAEMAIRIFVAESMAWRVAGLIENQMHGGSGVSSDASAGGSNQELKAIEEFAAECSMVKVYAAEMLDYVVDEGVQIHGGYGYHQDYAVERAYRDSRINRLFEGTSEINRLVITGMPLKRAARGQLPLLEAARAGGPRIQRCGAELAPQREEDRPADAGSGAPEIWRAARTTTGNHHEPVRHHHGSVCHGVGIAAQSQTNSGRRRSQRCGRLRRVFARCHRSDRTVVEDGSERLRARRRTAGVHFPLARVCESRSSECDRTAAPDCRTAARERAVYSLKINSALHLILGGAAVYRCDHRLFSSVALAAEVTLSKESLWHSPITSFCWRRVR